MWEPVDITRGLIVSGFLLLFIVRVHLLGTRNSPFTCWCHSTCVTLFPLVRLVCLIFTVPQTQEQIVGTSSIDETVTPLKERILLFLTVLATAPVE